MKERTRGFKQEPLGSDARGVADHGGEALHPFETVLQPLAAEVEDDLTHSEPGEGDDIALDLAGRAGEGAPLAGPRVERLGRVVDGSL